MQEQEKGYFIAAPADAPATVRGSTFDRKCARCGQAVMIAPSGQKILKEHLDLEIVCFPCARPLLAKSGGKLHPAMDAGTIAEELKGAMPNVRRHRN